MVNNPRRDITVEERRLIVEANYLAGMSYRDLAAQLGVSRSTIMRDVKAIVAGYRKEYADSIEHELAIHRRRLEVLLNAVWSMARGSTRDGVITPPNLGALDRALAIMDRITSNNGLANGLRPGDDFWKHAAVLEIKAGTIDYQTLATAFGADIADELFHRAGVSTLADQLFSTVQVEPDA